MDISKIQPADDYIIISEGIEEEKTSNGIILTGTIDKQSHGIVVAVANNISKYKVGDKVIFNNWAGHEYMIGDKSYTFFTEDSIIGVIKD